MNKHFFVLLALCVAVLSCNKPGVEESVFTLTEKTKTIVEDTNYSVSMSDVKLLLSGKKDVVGIKCYPSEAEPLLYVINMESGFCIIAGDKRAYPIIAYSNDAIADFDSKETHFILEEFAEPIRAITSVSDLTPEMRINVLFWDIKDNTFYMDNSRMTYYYLIQSVIVYYNMETIGPLLTTAWGQADHYLNDCYWNYYCPWADSSCAGAKCPVGCVAVSGGQLAYNLKDLTGVTVGIPISASCTGYAGNYLQSFSSTLSYNMIDNMPLNYTDTNAVRVENARVFLAYIGNQVGMNYYPYVSTAYHYALVSLLNSWGIVSHLCSFEESSMISQLREGYPIIVGGDTRSGHSWVMDGYKYGRYVRQNYYYVSTVPLTDEQIAALTMDDWNGGYEEYPTSPYPVKENHMNWGYNGNYNGWFSLYNWEVAGLDYSSNREMIRIY